MHIIKLLLKIGGWGFLAIAVIDLTITFFIYRHEHSFVQSASRAQATITKMVERQSGSDHSTAYYPVFTFQDSKGQPQEVYSSSGQYPPAYKVGDTVSVLYQPDKPANAEIDSFVGLWIWSLTLGAFGLFELVLGFGFFIVAIIFRKYERKTPVTHDA
jgi:hypothetical protein